MPTTQTPTALTFTIPTLPPFSHICVFLLPATTLPPGALAGIYLQLPESPNFKFLGAIGNEKESAIFKVGRGGDNGLRNDGGGGDDLMVDEIAPATSQVSIGGEVGNTSGVPEMIIGIQIEPAEAIAVQMEALKQERGAATSSSGNSSQIALRRGAFASPNQPSTKVLAQRIIENAFNFLASFATQGGTGEEMVPLKAFRDWWTKFEKKIEIDPAFLEKAEGA